MSERVDITSMTDVEKADLYAKQVKDMQDRQPTGSDSAQPSR